MPDIFRTSNGELIEISSRLGGGGEGAVFEVDADRVAKIYRLPLDSSSRRGANTVRKLTAMVAKPPPNRDASGNLALAWPEELLYYPDGQYRGMMAGFTMPRIDLSHYSEIVHYWDPQLGRQNANIPDEDERLEELLSVITQNILTILYGIHKRDYVVGDINESNLVVHGTGCIAFLDTDSFQVRDLSGTVHRCMVGRPEYISPRLIKLTQVKCPYASCPSEQAAGHNQSYPCFDRTVDDDNFAIAVVLFKLLMRGTHPLDGPDGQLLDRIASGQFPYNNPSLPAPARTRARWEELSHEWQEYFVDTFTTTRRYQAEELLAFGHPLKRHENLGQQVTVNWDQGNGAEAGSTSTVAGTAGISQIRCPKCGRPNAYPGIYCRYEGCEGWLVDNVRSCAACHVEIPFNAIYCPRCGGEQHPGRERDEVLRMR